MQTGLDFPRAAMLFTLLIARAASPAPPLEVGFSATQEQFLRGSRPSFELSLKNNTPEPLTVELAGPQFMCLAIDTDREIPMFMLLGERDEPERSLPASLELSPAESRLFRLIAVRFDPMWFTRKPALNHLPPGRYLAGCMHESTGFEPPEEPSPDWRDIMPPSSRVEFSIVVEK
jgi:hypothetical protein